MNTYTALKRLGRLEYAVVRTSLDIVDERVVQQFLADDSVVRQSFERALDYLDEAAAKWLHEPESTEPGDRPTRGEAATSSTRTSSDPRPDAREVSDPEPATQPEPLVQPEPVTQSEPVAQPEPAEEEQIEELATELLEEQQTETFAGELDEDEELRRVQAELNAKRLIEEQESSRRPHPE